MDSKALIGTQVRELRLAAGLSQEELAELADVHRTYVGSVERGESNSTVESLKKLAVGLKVPLVRLFDKCTTVPKRLLGAV